MQLFVEKSIKLAFSYSAKFLIEEAKIQSRGETGWRSHLSKGQNDLFGETPWIRKVSPWKRTGSFERKMGSSKSTFSLVNSYCHAFR